jgi:hypothetical protein
MILKRPVLALMALSFGLILGSCTQISGTVSDHWPHWAGGEPTDTPPRPGTPGYQDFIAHRQAATDAATAGAANNQPGTASAATAGTANNQPVALPAPAAANPASDDTAVARGGLY